MTSVRRIQLNLSDEEKAILDGQSKICNWLYNHLLATANDLRKKYVETQDKEISKVLYTERGLRNLVPDLKKDHKFLCAVFSSPLKNSALRLSSSIQDYQDGKHGRRKGKQTGWPKFRSWKKKWFSLLYDDPKAGFSVNGNKLKLSLGKNESGHYIHLTLKLCQACPARLESKIKNLRITRDGSKRYFAVFTIDNGESTLKNTNKEPKIIAFDPNHKNLVYGVDTDGVAIEIQNLAHLKKMDVRIDELKSRRDKCKKQSVKVVRPDGSFYWKSSRRWAFFNQKLDEAYRLRREQTKTFLYTLSNQICKKYDVICMGDYTPQPGTGITTSMRRSMNNQSYIGRFKKTLEWVTFRSGKLYFEYNEKGTTRTCSKCHFKVSDGISPEIREWDCPKCGTHHLRDENSAINGLEKCIRDKNLLPCSGHRCSPPVTERCVWWVLPSGVQVALRGSDGSALLDTAKKLKRCGATTCSFQTQNV